MALEKSRIDFVEVLTEIHRCVGELLIVRVYLGGDRAETSFESYLERVAVRPSSKEIGLTFDLGDARTTLALKVMSAFQVHHEPTDSYWLEFRSGDRRVLEIWSGTTGMLGLVGTGVADV